MLEMDDVEETLQISEDSLIVVFDIKEESDDRAEMKDIDCKMHWPAERVVFESKEITGKIRNQYASFRRMPNKCHKRPKEELKSRSCFVTKLRSAAPMSSLADDLLLEENQSESQRQSIEPERIIKEFRIGTKS